MLNKVDRAAARGTRIQSVERVLDILECLAESDVPLGVSEIGRQAGLKTPTAHNLLRTLLARGYVTQEVGGARYRLGFPCAWLGTRYQQQRQMMDIYRPAGLKLAAALKVPVYLALSEQSAYFFAACINAGVDLAPHYTEIWQAIDYRSICTRVFLAHESEPDLARYVQRHPFEDFGCDDLGSREDLDRYIEQCRQQGHLVYQRNQDTEMAIGVPVFDFSGRVVAVIGVAVPLVALNEREKAAVTAQVIDTARQISAQLGSTKS